MTARHLLACPFCGGPPSPIAVRGLSPYGVFPDSEMDGGDGLWVKAHVFCHECGGQGEEVRGRCYKRTEADALVAAACDLWNKRDQRHAFLYEASAADGLTVWPRQAAS